MLKTKYDTKYSINIIRFSLTDVTSKRSAYLIVVDGDQEEAAFHLWTALEVYVGPPERPFSCKSPS